MRKQSKKGSTNWCRTWIETFPPKLIHPVQLTFFFPLKDRSKKAAVNDWVGHVFDASVCEYKAEHRSGVLPLDSRQWPVPEPWPQIAALGCWRVWASLGYTQVQWQRAGARCAPYLFPLQLWPFLRILRHFSGCHWVSLPHRLKTLDSTYG